MYNAFESLQAFELGTGQRKERERETAMKNIGNAFASGDLDTAARMAFQYDPAYGMQVKKYADDQGALSTRKEIGGMFAAGDRTGALNRAMADGRFDLSASLYNMDRTMKAGGQEDYMGGIKDFVDRSGEIMALEEGDPRRAEMAMQIVSTSMFKDNPQFIAAVQQAAADGRITNTEIQSFQQKLMTVGEQIQQGQWQAGFDREGQYREEDVDWRTSQAAEDARRWDEEQARLKGEAEAKAGAPALDFGEVYRVREGNAKRLETFEASQRQYLTMQDLAADATGASDTALGFAFFKTIDPSSTVREGEFAQAASSMGLGASMVQMFARLDKGEKFSPQLRQDLLKAAGRAYEQQRIDIEGLVDRETQFASQLGVDPSLVIRNPVRGGYESDGTVFKGGSFERRIPPEALEEYYNDTEPDADAEFERAFGEGASQWARIQRLKRQSGMVR